MEDLLIGVIVAGLIGVSTVICYVWGWQSKTSISEVSAAEQRHATAREKNPNAAPTRLKNVWDVSKNSNTSSVKTSHGDKPFGSKYYYAHNNPNAIGGYKDGLKMEDYVMNGPRLLKKGGKPVETDNESRETGSDASRGTTSGSGYVSTAPQVNTPVRSIVKYLWDDPGDWNGIATIRIDTLPDKNGSAVDWREINVKEASASLLGEGLLVTVATDECKYQLKLSKLYGEAADVKAVVKPKRLLVKITKKKCSFLVKRKELNLDSWPQPHRKI
eukprot:scaffold1120_cov127-Cylindrotheca_fusiformis.AAC.15